MKFKRMSLALVVGAVLLLCGAEMASAGVTVNVDTVYPPIVIAPTSIPVPESGTILVGTDRVTLVSAGSGTTTLSDVTVNLLSSGGFSASDIASIRVYFEANGNSFYDNGASVDDILAGTVTSPAAFPLLVTLDTGLTQIRAGQTIRVFVAAEIKSTAPTATSTVAVVATSITEGGKAITVTHSAPTQKPLDKYRVGLAASNIAPASEYQGNSAKVLKLVLTPADTDATAAIRLSSLKLHAVGSPRLDSDINSSGVNLYRDSNSNGSYDPGVDQQVSGAAGTMSGAYATLTPSSPEPVPSGGRTFFVVVNISPTANYTAPDVIGLEIAAPATDVTFSDIYADDVSGTDFACVYPGRPYVQAGYLVSSPAVPSPNSPMITILQQLAKLPPVVQSIDPGNGAANFTRSASITATFSKAMDSASVTASSGGYPTNFKIFDGSSNEVAGVVTYDSGTMTATFNPTSDLAWGTTYTATIYGDGATGVMDSVDGLYMATNKVWSFTTTFAVYPIVLNTSPMNATIEIPRTTAVTATFSKPMNTLTITTSTFTLYDGAVQVIGTVGYDAGSRTATFTPTSPSPLAWGKVYTATVNAGVSDTDGLSPLSSYQWTFTTTAPVYPLVVATYPANTQTEIPRSSSITATFSKDMLDTSVQTAGVFTLKDSALATVDAAVTYNSGTFTATLDPTSDLKWGETYTARVTTGAQSLDGLAVQADSTWTFTTTVPIYPAVLSTTPGDLSRDVPCSSVISIIFSKDMYPDSINDTTILLHRGATSITGAVGYTPATRTATFTPTGADFPMLWETDYTLTVKSGATGVKSLDQLEMQAPDRTATFTTAVAVNPTVVNTVPAPDFIDVLPTAAVTALFSKTMKSTTVVDADTTIPPSNFILFEDTNTNGVYEAGTDTMVAASVAYDGGTKTATLTPASALDPGVTYTATITTGVQDADSLPMLADRVWSFTVTNRPVVTTTSPFAGAVEVLPSAVVTATFSKPLNSGTIIDADTSNAGSNFTVFRDANGNSVYDAGDTMVAGSVAWNAGTKVATFSHASAFLPGVTYCATITTGVQDLNGIAMAANMVWSFTTTPQPVVSSTTPPAGFVDVLPSAVISAGFSKTMDASTVNDLDATDAGSNFILFIDNNSDGDYDGGTDTIIAGSVSIDVSNTTATFTPSSALSPEVTYTATITTGVRDSYSIAMAANKVWSFTTTYRPVVSATSPSGGLVDVLPTALVTATFSKAMTASTINDANTLVDPSCFTLFADANGNSVYDAGDTMVGGSVAYDSGTKMATFTPSAALNPEATYCATITTGVQDANGVAMGANKVWSFTTTYRPVVSATSPSSGLVDVLPDSVVTATFSKAMTAATINDANTADAGSNFTVFADANGNSTYDAGDTMVAGSVAWNAGTRVATFSHASPFTPGLTYCAIITTGVQDANGIAMAANKVWSFTTTYRPAVSATTPSAGFVDVLPSTLVVATFSKTINPATIVDANTTDAGSNFILFVDNNTDGDYDGGTDTIIAGSVGIDVGNTVATFTPSSALSPEVTYTATITTGVQDTNSVPMAANKVWSFTTTYRPVVSATSPSGGLVDVLPTALVTATFSKAMTASTINDANTLVDPSCFTLFADANGNSVYDAGDTMVGGSVAYDSGTKIATLTPSAALSPGLTYCATITTGVQDANGVAMGANKVWSFTTTYRPVVSATSPSSGFVDVLPSALVTATFSKAMDSSTIIDPDTTVDPSCFTVFADANGNSIYDAGDTMVAGSVAWNAATKVATFTPAAPLSPEVTYCAIITTGVQDANGIAMASNKVWSFTTTYRPVVSATSPSSGFVDVYISAVVTATFSKAMDSTTIVDADTTDAGSHFIVFADANGNSIYDVGDTMVAGSVAWNAGTRVATFSHAVPFLPGVTYAAVISTGVKDGTVDHVPLLADKQWSFTTTYRPVVVSTSPSAGSVDVSPTSTITATFSKAMDSTTIVDADTTNAGSNFVVFQDSNANGAYDAGDTMVAGSVAWNAGTKVATFTHAAPFVPGVGYVAIISTGVKDGTPDHVAMLADKQWGFTSSDRPVVSSTTPADGFVNVLPGAVITATFSRPMDPATVDETTFLLKDSGGSAVTGTVTKDVPPTMRAYFTPTSPTGLTPGVTYTATIKGTVQDASAGHVSMDVDYTWSFTTSERPTVLSVSPAAGAVGVPRTSSIKIVFSKDVDDTTLTAANLTLTGPSGPVSGAITYDDTSYTATLRPDAQLAFAQYTVTVKHDVTDPDGIAMAVDDSGNYTWKFTTIPSLEEPVAANNKITPSSTAPVTIFIPEPPAGATDRVTVQVFTVTGKKVATLVNSRPYSEIAASLPLLWDGKNGQSKPLGPGIYFVQIKATGYTRTLKVMIVR